MIRPSIVTAIQAAIVVGLACAFAGHLVDATAPPRFGGVRPATKAGSWYPGTTSALHQELVTLLAQADPPINREHAKQITPDDPAVKEQVLALVCPHAAYRYSGLAAAHAYKLAQGQPVHRIFILGPLHRGQLHGVALPSFLAFSTPIGQLNVDTKVVGQLRAHPLFATNDAAHDFEYSLEMQLPFIRQVFGNVPIVPLLVGRMDNQPEIEQIAGAIKQVMSKDDLIIVSSDFTHYGAMYGYQPFKDNIHANILKLDATAYGYIRQRDLAGFLKFKKDTKDTICGFYPCCVLLALLPEGARATVADYYTSQDAAGTASELEKARSVSYLPVVFCAESWTPAPIGKKP